MLLTPESVEHIHRVVLYKCYVPELIRSGEESILEKYVDLPGWKCYDSDYPSELKTYCSHYTIAILGKGYDGFKYPDHVGVEIGDISSSSYYRLEVHYRNPEGQYSKLFFLLNMNKMCYVMLLQNIHHLWFNMLAFTPLIYCPCICCKK